MIPALMAGGEALSSLGQSSGLLSALGTSLFPAVDSMMAHSKQFGWFTHPVLPPPPTALIEAKLKGFFDPELNPFLGEQDFQLFNNMMRRQGIAFGTKGFNETDKIDFEPYKKAWQAILDASAVRPGIREAFTGYLAGVLDRKEFEKMLRTNGANPKDWDWMLVFYAQALDTDQVTQLWKRGRMTERQFDTYMKRLNYGFQDDIDKFKELTNIIPGPQDIIRFAIRDTFNPKLVTALGLDQELDENPEYLAWARAVGLGDVTIKDDKGKEITRNFAAMAWYAHWQLPSPGMAYEFTHRFYDKSRYGASPYLGAMKKFDSDDLKVLLKANDFSPQYRGYLEGISYSPFSRVDVRRIRAAGLLDKKGVYHNYRAIGYRDEEAFTLSEWVEKDTKDKEIAKVTKPALGKTCKAMSLGILDAKTFVDNMTALGMPKADAEIAEALCEMDNGNAIAADAIKSIMAGFMSGAFTGQEAKDGLKDYGVVPDRVEQYLSLWNLKLTARRRVVAAGEVSKWFVDGIIGIDEFISRLTKLQYNPADVTRIVQAAELEAMRRIEKAQKAAMLEAQRQIEKNLKEAEKLRRQAEQRQKEFERTLKQKIKDNDMEISRKLALFLAGRTDSNLKRWFHDGSISEDDVRQTLVLKGWDETDINRWVTHNQPKE